MYICVRKQLKTHKMKKVSLKIYELVYESINDGKKSVLVNASSSKAATLKVDKMNLPIKESISLKHVANGLL